jgi:hypothetical protein
MAVWCGHPAGPAGAAADEGEAGTVSNVRDVVVSLLAAALGALIALAWRAARTRLAYRASRRLWRPVLAGPCHIVVSEHAIDRSAAPLTLPRELTDLNETHAVAQMLARFAEARLPVRPHLCTPGRTAPEQLRDNLIVIGGPMANTVALKLNQSQLCGLQFVHDDAGRIVVDDTATGDRYTPSREQATVSGRPAEIRHDYGVIVSARNPFNLRRRVLYCSGTGGRGTMAAVEVCLERAAELMRRSRRFRRSRDGAFECLVESESAAGPPGVVTVVLLRRLPAPRRPAVDATDGKHPPAPGAKAAKAPSTGPAAPGTGQTPSTAGRTPSTGKAARAKTPGGSP